MSVSECMDCDKGEGNDCLLYLVSPMIRIISYGEILVDMLSDRILETEQKDNEQFTKFPGGAPANVAAAVAQLGGDSYFAGKISTDIFGAFLHDSLVQMGVKTDYIYRIENKKTALAFVSRDASGERSFEFFRSDTADLNFDRNDFNQHWFEEDGIFHACSNTLTEKEAYKTTLVGLKMAKNNDWLVSFDVNLRLSLWDDISDALPRVWDCLAQAHIVKLSKEELIFLADGGPEDMAIDRLLAGKSEIVVVTDGANPLICYLKGDQLTLDPPKVETRDSTAAGDAFVGGLLYELSEKNFTPTNLPELLRDKDELYQVLTFASSCGAFAATKEGAFTSLPNQHDLNGLMLG